MELKFADLSERIQHIFCKVNTLVKLWSIFVKICFQKPKSSLWTVPANFNASSYYLQDISRLHKKMSFNMEVKCFRIDIRRRWCKYFFEQKHM